MVFCSVYLSSNSKKIKPLIELEANENCLKICKQKQPFILLSAHTFGIWIAAIFASYFRDIFTYTYHGPNKASNQIYKLFQEAKKKDFLFMLFRKGKADVLKMILCSKKRTLFEYHRRSKRFSK